MAAVLAPCDLEEEVDERAELEALLRMYDAMLNDCMERPLSAEDQKELSELYACLYSREEAMWFGVSQNIIDVIVYRIDVDFPLLRQMADMLPSR